jgi:hypothetical protein
VNSELITTNYDLEAGMSHRLTNIDRETYNSVIIEE